MPRACGGLVLIWSVTLRSEKTLLAALTGVVKLLTIDRRATNLQLDAFALLTELIILDTQIISFGAVVGRFFASERATLVEVETTHRLSSSYTRRTAGESIDLLR